MEGGAREHHALRLLTLLLFLPAIAHRPVAWAGDEPGNANTVIDETDDGVDTWITTPGADGSATGGGTGSTGGVVRCDVRHDPSGMVAEAFDGTWPRPEDEAAGRVWWFDVRCPDGPSRAVWLLLNAPSDPATVTPATAARVARRFLPVPAPAVRLNPARGVVGIATWLWLDPSSWGTRETTLTLGGNRATVTATPAHVAWDTGAGTVTCDGPGVAYDVRRSASAQRTDCATTYRRSSAGQAHGAYTAAATSVWRIRWTATDATGVTTTGALPDLPRRTAFALPVDEIQTLVTTPDGAR